MTTREKIAAIEASGLPLAYDGCHKIYFLTDKEHEDNAAGFGYRPFFPATELRKLILSSCGLVFVSKWGLDNDDFAHPWNIEQFTEDLEEAAADAPPAPRRVRRVRRVREEAIAQPCFSTRSRRS